MGYAACGAIWTMRSASRAAEIRSMSGMVGMTPPASRRGSRPELFPWWYLVATTAQEAIRSDELFHEVADRMTERLTAAVIPLP